MQDWLVGLVGSDLAPLVSVLLSALLVVALAVFAISLMRRFMRGGIGFSSAPGPRVEVMDVTAIDPKRKLVLVRRDQVEHLLLIGGSNDLVVESRIGRPAPPPPVRQPIAPEPGAEAPVRPTRPPEPAAQPVPPRAPQAPEAVRPPPPMPVTAAAPMVEAPRRRQDETPMVPPPVVEPARRETGRVEPEFAAADAATTERSERRGPAHERPQAPFVRPNAERAGEPRMPFPENEARAAPPTARPVPPPIVAEPRVEAPRDGTIETAARDGGPAVSAPAAPARPQSPAAPPRSLATPVIEPVSRAEPAFGARGGEGAGARPGGFGASPAPAVAAPSAAPTSFERPAPAVADRRGEAEPVRMPEAPRAEPARSEERGPLTVRSFASTIGARQNPTPPSIAPAAASQPPAIPVPRPVAPAPVPTPASAAPSVPIAAAPQNAGETTVAASAPAFDDEDDDLARMLSEELAGVDEDDDRRDDAGRLDVPAAAGRQEPRFDPVPVEPVRSSAKEPSIEEEMERLMRDFAARTNDRA